MSRQDGGARGACAGATRHGRRAQTTSSSRRHRRPRNTKNFHAYVYVFCSPFAKRDSSRIHCQQSSSSTRASRKAATRVQQHAAATNGEVDAGGERYQNKRAQTPTSSSSSSASVCRLAAVHHRALLCTAHVPLRRLRPKKMAAQRRVLSREIHASRAQAMCWMCRGWTRGRKKRHSK